MQSLAVTNVTNAKKEHSKSGEPLGSMSDGQHHTLLYPNHEIL
jgi:hypothetical protein